MKYISLTGEEKTTLEEAYKNHEKHHVRQRCKALLLNNEGKKIPLIASLFSIRTRTIYTWINKWEEVGLRGLMIKPGQGRPPMLKIDNIEIVEEVKKKQKNMLEA